MQMLSFLLNMEKKSWSEIQSETTGSTNRHKKHHDMDVSEIVKEAQYRLTIINLDEFDVIFRFRLSGLKRLWGFRILSTFKIVWYDPTHKIYPVD